MKFITLFLLLISPMLWAESFVYITDNVDIPIRSEKNFGDNIVRSLPSGTKLSVLQATEDGWTQIKFEATTGWIISRYLTNKPPASDKLKTLKQTSNANKLLLSKQKDQLKTARQDIKTLKKENANLSIQTNKLKAEKQHIKKTYQNSLKLEHTNQGLNSIVLQLKSEMQLLKNNNTTAQDSSARNWFIVGAVVLFFGIFLGYIMQKSTNQRRI